MALTMPSDLVTGQGFIPVSSKGNRRKIVGKRSYYETIAELNADLVIERANMGINPLMQPGEKVDVGDEPGHRIYSQDLATPANSNCRLFEFKNGHRILLGSDNNIVTRLTAAPTAPGATSGDYAWVQATNMLYAWTGTWSAGTLLPGAASGGGSGGTTIIPFATVLDFRGNYDMEVKYITGNTVFTADMTGAKKGAYTDMTFVGNGINVPQMPAGATEEAGSFSFDNSVAGNRTSCRVTYDGVGLTYMYGILVGQTPVAPPTGLPQFTGQPAIVGTPVEGVAASFTPAAATGTPTPTITHEYLLDGVGTGSASFTPAASDVNKALRVKATAVSGANSISATSAAVLIVSAGAGTGDADYDSYVARLAAVGYTMTTAEADGTRAFFTSAKTNANPFWDVLYRVNPFLNNAAASLVPLKMQNGSTNDTQSTTAVNAGGRSLEAAAGYVDIKTPPPSITGGLSFYHRSQQPTNPAQARVFMGCRNSDSTKSFRIAFNLAGDGSPLAFAMQGLWGGPGGVQSHAVITNAQQYGHWHSHRNSNVSHKLRRNGVLMGSEFTTDTTVELPTENIYLFCHNAAGSPATYVNNPTSIGYYAVLSGPMTDAQATAYNNAVVALMTALGRNL